MKKLLLAGMMSTILVISTACSSQQLQKAASTVPAKQESKQSVDAYGVVKATDVKNINIDFPAIVEKVAVREGQRVNHGDSLVTLDLKEYEAQIKSKELELNSNQSEVSRLQSYYLNSNSNPDLQKYTNDLNNANTLYNQAVEDLQAKQKLFDAGSISKSELDDFKNSVDAKKKNIDDIKFQIDSLKFSKKTEVDPKLTKTATLDSDLKVMKDKLERSYLKGNEIIADVPRGVVYEIGYVPGDIISSSKKVLSILNLDSLVIEADVSEEFIKDVKTGSEATIIPQADKSRQYKGKVTRISNKTIQKNGETDVTVEISIDHQDDFLLPEYNVDVKIDIDPKK